MTGGRTVDAISGDNIVVVDSIGELLEQSRTGCFQLQKITFKRLSLLVASELIAVRGRRRLRAPALAVRRWSVRLNIAM